MQKALFTLLFLPSLIFAQSTIEVSENLELIPLTQNTWIHRSYSESPSFGRFSSNGLLFIQDAEAWLFDTPMDDTVSMLLFSYLVDSMHLKLVGFTPNHWHDDCTGGMKYLNKLEVPTHSYSKTNKKLQKEGLALAKATFSDSVRFTLGDKSIFCFFLGKAHAQDNIVTWIPSENVLFGGCMVKSLKATHLGYIGDADLEQWPMTLDRLLDKFQNAQIIVPGHGNPGDEALLLHTKDLIKRHFE
jgi:metallo-beta-lactamase class B